METLSSFTSIFDKVAYGNNYTKTFDDFLIMCLCAFSRNPETGLSYNEDEYLQIIEPYKKDDRVKYFPQLLGSMILYMEDHKDSDSGNDLLGSFYEKELSLGKNGQFFTPFHICSMMAKMQGNQDKSRSLNILDPCCGSGRMLMAHGKSNGGFNNHYGIDIDPLCVRMTTINLFLNGLSGEVICANALIPDDFRFGYRISFLPFGVFRIDKKEDSVLWQINQATFESRIANHESNKPTQEQLRLF